MDGGRVVGYKNDSKHLESQEKRREGVRAKTINAIGVLRSPLVPLTPVGSLLAINQNRLFLSRYEYHLNNHYHRSPRYQAWGLLVVPCTQYHA